MTDTPAPASDAPQHRYSARLANEIEAKWQDRWERDHTFWAPNPTGPLERRVEPCGGQAEALRARHVPLSERRGAARRPPVGYIGTDVYARFMRMNDRNVLHAMGYDSFGLPAEQYAVEHGQHPRATVDANVATMRRQLRALGPRPRSAAGHRHHRRPATTGGRSGSSSRSSTPGSTTTRPAPVRSPSSPTSSSPARAYPRATPTPTSWRGSISTRRRAPRVVDSYRLAYLDEAHRQLVPGTRHRARERGSHARRAQRPRQPPRVPAPA